jgi:hypothetical protein
MLAAVITTDTDHDRTKPAGLGSLTHNTNFYAQTPMSTIRKSTATHPPLTRDDVLDGRDVAQLLPPPDFNGP